MEQQQTARDQIAADVAAYLLAGGVITTLPPFNDPSDFRKLPVRNFKDGARYEN